MTMLCTEENFGRGVGNGWRQKTEKLRSILVAFTTGRGQSAERHAQANSPKQSAWTPFGNAKIACVSSFTNDFEPFFRKWTRQDLKLWSRSENSPIFG